LGHCAESCLGCVLQPVQIMIGSARDATHAAASSTLDSQADRSVVFWLPEVSDAGASNAGLQCVSNRLIKGVIG
jgi:hypothetical protein